MGAGLTAALTRLGGPLCGLLAPATRAGDPALRKRTLRFKLYSLLSLPIVALILLWTFITGYLVSDVFELRRAVTQFEQVAVPAFALADRVRDERHLSAVLLSGTGPDGGRLSTAREETDRAVVLLHQRATSQEGSSATGPDVVEGLTALERELQRLGGLREQVDSRSLDRLGAVQQYTEIQNSLYRMTDRLVTVPDPALYRQANGLQTIAGSRELLSQEDALLSGALLRGQLGAEEQRAFAQIVAGRRLLFDRGMRDLDPELRRPYDGLLSSADYKRLTAIENEVGARRGALGQATAWQGLAGTLGTRVDRLTADSAALLNLRADDASFGIVARIAIAAGLGLVAILLAVVLSARLGRGLSQELADLRSAALELADVRLPGVVRKLRDSEPVEVDTEAPPIHITGTTLEVQDVAQAFSTVRRTAVKAAVGQADLRRGVSLVFRNLARRNQSLLHRQLTHLDTMQRKTNAPDAQADLFRLDHLTTRMRRQAEGLIILSGAPAGRAWRRPVPMHDVVRGSVAEVEDYSRVTVMPMSDASLVGTAVADVIHMLAELIENATVFSPPSTRVYIRGDLVGRGFAVEIEDRGLGLTPEDREEINRRLVDPPEFNLADSDRLGLFVVSRLAARHDIKVALRRSPYGGTTAVVLLPHGLVIPAGLDEEPAGPDTGSMPAVISLEQGSDPTNRR
ncbi:sensor [Sphaerisporangium album]|uniref:histidine kinase n=1 Tax=Sphaerisporangium album TaxID=509200 RepID=A0A367FLR2_9ACTN|nr:nitrate- and nitrite sensing domain-containing protein [Sphaerisporangium album]RCG30657.1 sensor [Sphaerisporangium album]